MPLDLKAKANMEEIKIKKKRFKLHKCSKVYFLLLFILSNSRQKGNCILHDQLLNNEYITFLYILLLYGILFSRMRKKTNYDAFVATLMLFYQS